MKVYLVSGGNYDDYSINKIFNTKEKAQTYIDSEGIKFPNLAKTEWWRIEIWEVE